MGILEVLTLNVGPAIAKIIIKLWLKDSEIARDVTSNIVDLISKKIANEFTRRRGTRQFEEMSDKIIESLLPIFEAERKYFKDENGRELKEEYQIPVAYALSDTLNNTPITASLLTTRNLDPSKLAKFLISSNPTVTVQLSELQVALYERMIFEICQKIVDIASQLPSFQERAFSEILRRENVLITTTDQILTEIYRIQRNSQFANADIEIAHFERDYRLAVVRNLDRVELFGVDLSQSSKRHRLSVAYVTLAVKKRQSSENSAPGVGDFNSMPKLEQIGPVAMSVDRALAQGRRLLIRGPAGSGKTTLMKWIAVRSASQTFNGELSDWNNTIPFFIRLRQFRDSRLPSPEEFPRLVTSSIAGMPTEGWVYNQMNSGRAIILIDGVDEMPRSQRASVREWLLDLVGAYADTRFIVTSRPHAVTEGWMKDFQDAELQPMDLSDVQTFIDKWHYAVREEVQDDNERAELETLAKHLNETLMRNRSIRNLATSPLLCAMICALHRDRHQQLPSDRIELYDACCRMLIERRDIERHVTLEDYLSLSYRHKLVLLQDIAYWLLLNGWSMVTLERVQERLQRKLINLQGIPQGATVDQVLNLLLERSGMIREPVVGQIDFTHRTFQEYLAAQAILDEGNYGLLVRNAHDDQWREVIILAAGLAQPKAREALIKELINRGDKEHQLRHQLHLLAVACLETAIELAPDIKAELQDRLVRLVPPKSMSDAKALSSAGDLAVPHLFFRNTRRQVSTTAACIRTLGLIGGDFSLDAIESYVFDSRPAVVAELILDWDYFEPEIFAQRVLSKMKSIRLEGSISQHNFKNFRYLTHLTALALLDCRAIQDLSPLYNLTSLTSLELRDCPNVRDLTPLSGLDRLTSLTLYAFDKITDLSPLKNLNGLITLNIHGCQRVWNLSPLLALKNLRELGVSNLIEIPEEIAQRSGFSHI